MATAHDGSGRTRWPARDFVRFRTRPTPVTRFFGPVKVNNTLEWGAEQTCEGDYAPQYIRMRLQSTCTDWYCQRFVDETTYLRTPPSEDFTRVSRRHFNPRCGSGTLRKYRIKALAYVRGVEFGPFISNESVQACDISP
jgi:hypothetical protein